MHVEFVYKRKQKHTKQTHCISSTCCFAKSFELIGLLGGVLGGNPISRAHAHSLRLDWLKIVHTE